MSLSLSRQYLGKVVLSAWDALERLWVRRTLHMVVPLSLAVSVGLFVSRAPTIDGSLFESLLTLVYTAPAIGLAFYGLMKNQAPKSAQIADELRDRFNYTLNGLAVFAAVSLLFAVALGLRYSGTIPTSAAEEPARDAAFWMVFSSLLGVYAILRGLIHYRRGLDSNTLAQRLRDDHLRAVPTDMARAQQRAEELEHLALLSFAQGRVADFDVFVETLGVLAPSEHCSVGEAEKIREYVDELVFRTAENVVHRADLFGTAVTAALHRLETGIASASFPDRVPNLFTRTLSSDAPVVSSVVRLVSEAWQAAGVGFWRRILVESIVRGVDDIVWEAVRLDVSTDWAMSSERITEQDLTVIINDAFTVAGAKPTTQSVHRLVDLLVSLNRSEKGKRPITPPVAKALASKFGLIAGSVSTVSALDVFDVLKPNPTEAAWALNRFGPELTPEVRLVCHIELTLSRSRRTPTANSTRDFLVDHEFRLQLDACKTVLRRSSPQDTERLKHLYRLFRTHSLGHIPLIARLEEAVVGDGGNGSLERSAKSGDLGLPGFLGPGFSQREETLSETSPADEPSVEERSERIARADQVFAVLGELVDEFGARQDVGESAVRPALVKPGRGWDACLLILLEVYRTHDCDNRFPDLVRRLVGGFPSFESLYKALTPEMAGFLASHAETLVGEILPDGDEPLMPTRFARSVESGTLALLIGSIIRRDVGAAEGVVHNAGRDFAAAVVRAVDQPGTRVVGEPLFLAEVLGDDLAVVFASYPISDDEQPRDGRVDFCAKLLQSMVLPGMEHLGNEREITKWSALLATYFATNPPSENGKERARSALVRAAVILDAAETRFGAQAHPARHSGASEVQEGRRRLREALQSWLSQGGTSEGTRRFLSLEVHKSNDDFMPGNHLDSDRYRFRKIIARELIDAGIGVAPKSDSGIRWQGTESDFLALLSKWIRPPAGASPTQEDAELAARGIIQFLGATSPLRLNEEQRSNVLTALTKHFSTNGSSGRFLYDKLTSPSKTELLKSVLRVLLDVARDSTAWRPNEQQVATLERVLLEELRDASRRDPGAFQPFFEALNALKTDL